MSKDKVRIRLREGQVINVHHPKRWARSGSIEVVEAQRAVLVYLDTLGESYVASEGYATMMAARGTRYLSQRGVQD